ncbi:50S ribosomal protein L24 [Candidatus Poribacteria bacterium]|nr:50S ribosomal protein L24 [Candidatus Poribacteria bacterium]
MSTRKVHVKRDDTVVILTGKDRGKTGRVLSVYPDTNRVLVERVNLLKHHSRHRDPSQQGIVEREAPVHASNVMLVCPRCNRQSRTYRKKLETGFRVRVCRKCQEVVDG